MFIPENLSANRSRYPEFSTEYDAQHIEYTKALLLQLPLFHSSRKPLASITPYALLPEEDEKGNTYALDMSLGLDQFCFLKWGMPDWSQYGQYMYVLNPSLLYSPNVVVTQTDVVVFAGWEVETPFDNLPKKDQKRVLDEYFGKMLSGPDWLELTARKVLSSVRHSNGLYELHNGGVGMGEIKHFGPLDSTWITGCYVGREELEQLYYPYMYSLGFGYEGSEQVRKFALEGRFSGLTDPLPEDLGVDYAQALAVWDVVRHI